MTVHAARLNVRSVPSRPQLDRHLTCGLEICCRNRMRNLPYSELEPCDELNEGNFLP